MKPARKLKRSNRSKSGWFNSAMNIKCARAKACWPTLFSRISWPPTGQWVWVGGKKGPWTSNTSRTALRR
jgi:hypothetical protein